MSLQNLRNWIRIAEPCYLAWVAYFFIGVSRANGSLRIVDTMTTRTVRRCVVCKDQITHTIKQSGAPGVAMQSLLIRWITFASLAGM